MDCVKVYLLWLIFNVDIYQSSVKANDVCGKVEILTPAISGRNVTFTFSPTNDHHTVTAQWRRQGADNPWSLLSNSEKFVQDTENGVYYLIVTNSKLGNDEVNYHVVYNTSDDSCTTSKVTLNLDELRGCGMLYLRTKKIRKYGKVELGYYPTSNNSVRYWMRNSSIQNGFTRINLSTVNVQETLSSNNEYILEMKHFVEADTGSYRVQCSTEDQGRFTKAVIVDFPVPPSTPVLSPLKTINECENCIVGKDHTDVRVSCEISGGSKPFNVTMVMAGTKLTTEVDGSDDGLYSANIRLNDTIHMSSLTCSVENYATISPLTVTVSIYVKKLSYVPPSLLVPSRLIEGEPVNITCLVPYVRPPATNITMYIDGTALDGMEIKQELNHVTLLYNSWVILTKFQRIWNKKKVTCCEYNEDYLPSDRGECSAPKIVDYAFPPESVTLHIDDDIKEEKQYYLIEAICYVNHSHPICNAIITAPNGIVVSQGQNRVVNNTEDGSRTSIYSAIINATVENNGKIVTCTPSCNMSFDDTPSSSKSLLVPYVPNVVFNTSSSVVQISRGSVIYVKCTSHSHPPSNITWYDATSNTTIPCRERVEASLQNDRISSTTAERSDIDYNRITECTMEIDAQNSSMDTFNLFCRAHHIFKLIDKKLTINVEEVKIIKDENHQNEKQLPVDLIGGVGAGVVLLVICVVLVLACNRKKTKVSGDEIPAPADIEINEQDQDDTEPQSNNQMEQSLVYADLEFDVSTDSTNNPVLKRRESPVEYITIDFVKTVEKTGEINNDTEDENIYINQ